MGEKIAVIGGLGTLSGGDLFFKLLKNKRVLKNQLDYHFIFEQQPYSQINLPLHQEEDIKSRKFYSYNICKNFEQRGITKILLPCFASHSFLDELQKEIAIPIVNIFIAIAKYVKTRFPVGTRIGIMTSDYVKQKMMLEKYFSYYELMYPAEQTKLMEAIYGKYGIKNGYLEGIPLEYINEICKELISNKCDVILPGITELSLLIEPLRRRGIPILDVNQIYADYALENSSGKIERPFKLGILGGVGPSATVDFMNKIIKNTPAKIDQGHIKMVVEQNPQIPDRTANLVNKETDPTVAMFSTCKRLEAEGADTIAIPCNTAHAFVGSIQEHLKIPIINMLTTTAEYIVKRFGKSTKVGLLATSGTVQSGVYHDVFIAAGVTVIIPDTIHQQLVMESIYGEKGVKAGQINGICRQQILAVADHLIGLGAQVIILGCTELPLLFPSEEQIYIDNRAIQLVDPTEVLAKKIVAMAKNFSNKV
ncbi:amino acid racemase [Sphingobacterium sp.]|uniref:amino acid racemase n=1 Tax=Sphingobacterium sp. TaxID=341027 RepID=UPI0028973694|nr:amino acid racemase [Sphingobacterium sp.]